ncbi:cytidylyltransferase domain-containing protein [Devosia sp. Naph2]|uniref:acylneuraminate cytidylyltransferase family protein n=1 Tax=Devosia polycyclovorans TaxID=3345148 RepID=UPI0035CF7E27
MSTLAIIPARGGSKRLPGKNIRPFAGTPLIAWSIRFAQAYPGFDRVAVSTDSTEIAAVSAAAGTEVTRLRPVHLATDTATTISVVLDVLTHEASEGRRYDTVALLQPTSPMRLARRWDEAFALLEDPGLDAVIGVSPVRTHPFHTFTFGSGALVPLHDRETLKQRSQDLPMVVAVAGNLYLARTSALVSHQTFFPKSTAGVLCDEPFETIDIDDELDWIVAETIANRYGIEP